MMFRKLLSSVIKVGTLGLIDAKGNRTSFGQGKPIVTLRMNDPRAEYEALMNPPLKLAEAYMDGRLTLERGTLHDLLELFLRNYERFENHWLAKVALTLGRQVRWAKQYNPIGTARRNIAHHYDLSGRLYDLFLDRDRQYSCAYFTGDHDDLERAQLDKKRHIAAKLLLDRPDLSVLDVGSGWGGLGLYLAETTSCRLTGVTLSVEQHKLSRDRAKNAGLTDRAEFLLKDYRELAESYDRIVSVGMFEHVGKRNYDEFFRKTYDLLADDGVFLLHSIGRFNQPGPINPFIRKYIFPGADVPTLSEVLPSIERAGFFVTDIEILRLHYAETLRHWHARFQANRGQVRELYDERFCRMWELYLVGCEMGFRHQGLMVFQLQLAKRQDAVPLTRDYIFQWEREHGVRAQQAAE